MIVEPLSDAITDDVRALFEAAGSGCFCRYWHFKGTKNEWLDRCAHRPEENLTELMDAARAGDATGDGLVARADAAERDAGQPPVLGWMKLTRRASVPKLLGLPVYRSIAPHRGAEDTTWVIGCFLVHPLARRRGVARALVAAAEPRVRSLGGRVIEAFPRRSSDPLYDEEMWQGPEALFRSCGYEVVFPPGHNAGGGDDDAPADALPYPLYRRLVDPPPTSM